MPLLFTSQLSQYIDLTNSTAANTGIFNAVSQGTISAWIRLVGMSTTDRIIMSFSISGSGTQSTPRIFLGIRSNSGETGAHLIAGGNATTMAGLAVTASGTLNSLVTDTWYHVGAVVNYAANQINIYLNGVLDTSSFALLLGSVTPNVNSANAAVGSNCDGQSLFFNGVIHDVRAYNRGLSADEIKTIYSARGRDKIVLGLMSRYVLSEYSTGTANGNFTIKNEGALTANPTPKKNPIYVRGILRIK